jgi:hypothetical protein
MMCDVSSKAGFVGNLLSVVLVLFTDISVNLLTITFLSGGIATSISKQVFIIIISCHRFSFFSGTSPLEPVVNPTIRLQVYYSIIIIIIV